MKHLPEYADSEPENIQGTQSSEQKLCQWPTSQETPYAKTSEQHHGYVAEPENTCRQPDLFPPQRLPKQKSVLRADRNDRGEHEKKSFDCRQESHSPSLAGELYSYPLI